MISSQRFRLKQPSGWFAAGREVACAATLLSDAAFKLFVWLCLHADRSRGSLSATVSALAIALGRNEAEIGNALEELVQKDVCRISSSSTVEISDRFWPYERVRSRMPSCLNTSTGSGVCFSPATAFGARSPPPTKSSRPNCIGAAFPSPTSNMPSCSAPCANTPPC